MGVKSTWVLFPILFTLLSCRKEEQILFEIPIRLNFEIAAGLNPFDRHFYKITNVGTNIQSLRNQFDVPEDRVLIIRPASAIFSSLHRDIDFDFIEEIGISVYQGLNQDDDTDVFLTDFVPINAGRHINILPFDADYADVLDHHSINFLVSLRVRAPTPVFFECNIDIKFTVE